MCWVLRHLFVVALMLAGLVGVAQADDGKVVALTVPKLDVFDNPTGPSRQVARVEIPLPLTVLGREDNGLIKVELGGKPVWLDRTQVKISGDQNQQSRCPRPVVTGLAPLGTMGVGDSCKR